MAAQKGGRLHRLSGNVFTVAMLTLASSGLILAILRSQTGNINWQRHYSLLNNHRLASRSKQEPGRA